MTPFCLYVLYFQNKTGIIFLKASQSFDRFGRNFSFVYRFLFGHSGFGRRDRQTERQTDRNKERKREKQIERERERERETIAPTICHFPSTKP